MSRGSTSAPSLLLLVWVCSCVAGLGGDATNELWFPVGETLEYKIYWGIIPVGRATLSTEWVEEDGRRLIALRGVGRTGPVVATIFPVEDVIESIVDPDTFLPVRYTQRLREGRHRRHDVVTFDHDGRVANWVSLRKNTSGVLPIASDTRDVLSLVYSMRSRGFAVGQKEFFRVLVDNKLYDLHVRGVRRRQLKVRGYGEVESLEVEPEATFGGVFVRKGRVWIWFSLDPRHLLLRARAKVPVASLRARLVRVAGPGVDVWAADDADE